MRILVAPGNDDGHPGSGEVASRYPFGVAFRVKDAMGCEAEDCFGLD